MARKGPPKLSDAFIRQMHEDMKVTKASKLADRRSIYRSNKGGKGGGGGQRRDRKGRFA